MKKAQIISGGLKRSISWIVWSQLIVLLIFCFAGCVKTPEELKEEARPYMDRGIRYLQMRNATGALTELLKAVEINPDDPQTHNWLGLAYYLKNKYVDSEKHLKKAIELDQNYSEARNNLGATYMAMKKWDLAIEQYKIITNDVLYRSPDMAFNNLGKAYFEKGMLDDAVECYQKSIELFDGLPISHNNLGVVWLKKKKFEDARREFERAIELLPDYAEPHYGLAKTYVQLKMLDEAVKEFKEVIRLDPSGSLGDSSREYISILGSYKNK